MSLLLKRALDLACYWHRDHARKYPGLTIPYASHVAGVALRLARHGFDDEVVAAGALHDVIEDSGVTRAELEREFGPRVADLVELVSETDKSASWEARKRAYIERFPHEPWEAQAITLADKIDNFESIVTCRAHFGDPWSMFRRQKSAQLERFRALEVAASKLAPHPLIDEFRAALAAVAAV